jgi:hypothetical protein
LYRVDVLVEFRGTRNIVRALVDTASERTQVLFGRSVLAGGLLLSNPRSSDLTSLLRRRGYAEISDQIELAHQALAALAYDETGYYFAVPGEPGHVMRSAQAHANDSAWAALIVEAPEDRDQILDLGDGSAQD